MRVGVCDHGVCNEDVVWPRLLSLPLLPLSWRGRSALENSPWVSKPIILRTSQNTATMCDCTACCGVSFAGGMSWGPGNGVIPHIDGEERLTIQYTRNIPENA